MKKYIAWILIFCLTVLALTGCAKETPPAETASPASAGGWTVSTESGTPSIPEDAQKAFEAAVSGLTGVGYEPIAYLGSQVVAGVNYGFLCRAADVSSQSAAKLCTVKVYRDLSGNASILDIQDIAIADFTGSGDLSYTPDGLAGGWSIDPNLEPAVLPDAVQTAFEKATAGLTGVGYHPLACLGSQVVAGSNYAILCRAVTVTAQPQSALAVITVYADLNGGAQITSVCGFDFP